MASMSREARQALRDMPPLRVGGADLVEGSNRSMWTPTEHQAQGVGIKAVATTVRVAPVRRFS